jgi:hypothetical protein
MYRNVFHSIMLTNSEEKTLNFFGIISMSAGDFMTYFRYNNFKYLNFIYIIISNYSNNRIKMYCASLIKIIIFKNIILAVLHVLKNMNIKKKNNYL